MSASTIIKYINPEDIEKDFPGLEKELQKRHSQLDMKVGNVIEEKAYPQVGEWEGYPVYSIPVENLLGVRSASFCRRKGAYRYFIREMVNETFAQPAPILCFVAGDLMLRVKWGNIFYWGAKETKKVPRLNCVFAGSPEKTEFLKSKFLEQLMMPDGTFI